MPATAGRVRMPANNRVHSSAALQTHGIWQSAIGYDPYAPTNKDDTKKPSQSKAMEEPEQENAYASFQGLLALARITNSNSDEARGACKKCGRVGHLYYQCRNFLSAKEDIHREGKDEEFIAEKLKGEKIKLKVERRGEESTEEEEEEEESDSSDSFYDSEIEKKINEPSQNRQGSGKGRVLPRREEDEEKEKRKKRGRSKKRRSGKRENSDSEDEDEGRRRRRKKRKEKRRRDDESSDEEEERRRRKRKSRREKRRRRSHRHSSEDSDSSSEDSADKRHKRRSRRAASSSEASESDDSRVGRGKKRIKKNGRKRHREMED